jgi:hypothetical protein
MSGCGGQLAPRLRFVSSQATQASWSFVVDDHAQGAALLVDGRERTVGCDRAGRELRCELRGMFPGGHTVELRLPGATLKRSVIIGRAWPERPALVRVRSADEAKEASDAGADAVIADPATALQDLQDLADAAHARGVRLFAIGDAQAIEHAAADGVIGAAIPAEVARRFPEARALAIDAGATQLVEKLAAGGPLGDSAQLAQAGGLVEGKGLIAGTLALLAPRGAVVDRAVFPLLSARKRHAALRTGTQKLLTAEPARLGLTLTHSGDEVTILVNGDAAPWPVRPPGPSNPLDLLGGHVQAGEISVAPHDVAVIVNAPAADRTRF